MKSRKYSAMVFLGSNEISNGFYPFIGTGPIFFNQMQAWVKTITEREIFFIQFFFDQLIFVYDNFRSMEITAKNLNKMKQKNKQPFSTFISGFGKKMLETEGMDFNDQITKTFFNKFFNNEMHKTFIGFFIPAIYIAYCNMFHGINNQFEVLRVKNGMTTTIIKIIENFTTGNSITNDEINWEFTVTNSFTKMVKRRTE